MVSETAEGWPAGYAGYLHVLANVSLGRPIRQCALSHCLARSLKLGGGMPNFAQIGLMPERRILAEIVPDKFWPPSPGRFSDDGTVHLSLPGGRQI